MLTRSLLILEITNELAVKKLEKNLKRSFSFVYLRLIATSFVPLSVHTKISLKTSFLGKKIIAGEESAGNRDHISRHTPLSGEFESMNGRRLSPKTTGINIFAFRTRFFTFEETLRDFSQSGVLSKRLPNRLRLRGCGDS